ncbi:hypothetical protein Niako_0216 [Niastella koreensis GR20-10]|uniref:Uncharacterized protein n=1 Tax=Niastella koreensis (strain DSM 17620 / KACC 11465 / NBRC 106392 / GR20-10) TaxID=700598 RepID=G8TMV4_NIAKG|nr:hypothetical protein Niako_0216 [Niastella koreensis GR20-10]
MYHFFLLGDSYSLSRLSLIINVFWENGPFRKAIN